jgi:hypothetical protein
MSERMLKAELFARGWALCRGTVFAGDVLGRAHQFTFSDHQVRVSLPSAEFEIGSNKPVGTSSKFVRFRSGYADDLALERSFYELDYVVVEVDFKNPVQIPKPLLDNESVQKSPELAFQAPHLDKLAVRYDSLLVSAWNHWMRVARWATNQYTIGLPDWTTDESADVKMLRVHEKNTGYGVWASPNIVRSERSATIDTKRWDHIGRVLATELTPPIWFEYLVEARQRLFNQDFSGCVLSSVIACETIARATYRHHTGTPANAAAEELVDRTAAQAIIGRWKDLTGIKAEGKVHHIFDIRNRLVHSGRTDSVDAKAASNTFQTARNFVENGDEWWFAELGLSNPRMVDFD